MTSTQVVTMIALAASMAIAAILLGGWHAAVAICVANLLTLGVGIWRGRDTASARSGQQIAAPYRKASSHVPPGVVWC